MTRNLEHGTLIRSVVPPMRKTPGVISITSGKGGVGKTVVAANLGVVMARAGKKVLLLDADLGLSNMDVVFGLTPQHNLNQFFSGERELAELIVEGPQGIKILPAGSGMQALMSLSTDQQRRFSEGMEGFYGQFDLVILDTGSGISENVIYFNVAAQEIVLVTTPEPTAVMATCSLMRLLSTKHHEKKFNLVVNMVESESGALETYRKLTLSVIQEMEVSINYLGGIPFDRRMQESILQQEVMVELFRGCRTSICLAAMAQKLPGFLESARPKGTIQFFWQHLLSG